MSDTIIGSLIGKYKIVKLIGEGGMASVYEAQHQLLNTRAAIKILNPVLSSNTKVRERFLNEARLMATLNHPNITKVIDFEEFSHQLYIIMEFLEGEELTDKIKNSGSLKDEEIENYFNQILSAFQYAHENGIVHRDIKPSNIFVLKNGQIKILDFGIAKLFGEGNESTQAGTQLGTPMYMSPEQVKSDRSIDHRSDIYSLGVTLYFAVTGKTPYDSNTNSQFDIYNKIVYEPIPNVPSDSKFSKIIEKACNKNRDLRYQTCSDWLEDLKLALKGNTSEPLDGNNIDLTNKVNEKSSSDENVFSVNRIEKEIILKKDEETNNSSGNVEHNSLDEDIVDTPTSESGQIKMDSLKYFYSENGKTLGPFSLIELKSKINSDTIVSTDEISWKKANEFSEINAFFPESINSKAEKDNIKTKSNNKTQIIILISIFVISLIISSIYLFNSSVSGSEAVTEVNSQDSSVTLNSNYTNDNNDNMPISKNDTSIQVSKKIEDNTTGYELKSPLTEYYNKKDMESKYLYLRDVIFPNKLYNKNKKDEYEKILLDVYNHLTPLFNSYSSNIDKITELCNFKDDLNSEIKYLGLQGKINPEVDNNLNEKCNN
jgi:serine/threonine protein kinase